MNLTSSYNINSEDFGLREIICNSRSPENLFEKEFLKWYSSFLDYEEKGRVYKLNNPRHISYKESKSYSYSRIKKRIIIKILEELFPESKFLISTDFDEFCFGIDCIEIDNNGEIKAIDFKLNIGKKKIYDVAKPLDFLNSSFSSLDIRKNGIKKEIYYFNDTSIIKLIYIFIYKLKNGEKIESFYEIYSQNIKDDFIKKAKKNTQERIRKIF